MIKHDEAQNQPPVLHGRSALVLLLLVVFLASGCNTPPSEKTTVSRWTYPDCPIVIDTSGWDAFFKTATKASADSSGLTSSHWLAVAELEPFRLQRGYLGRDKLGAVMDASSHATILGGLFQPDFLTDAKARLKRTSLARRLHVNYHYSFEYAETVNTRLAQHTQEDQVCGLWDLTSRWVDPDKFPASVTLYFLPMTDEIITLGEQYLIDTGLAAAGTNAQLNRQLAGLFYRRYQAQRGDDPMQINGLKSVTHTWRLLANQGVEAWIKQLPDIYFNKTHPTLSKYRPIPDGFFNHGHRLIQRANRIFATLMADPSQLQTRGWDLARLIKDDNTYITGGYAMAATIAGRLGEERLLAVHTSVPDFIAAYQEAALANPLPLPRPGAIGHQLYESMPAFDPEVYDWLMPLLRDEFPN